MGILNFMRKKKLVTLGVAMVLGTMLLSGCGGKDTKTKAASDTLYIGMSNPPEFFNPLVNPGVAGKFAIRFMYDSLLGMPEPNHFTPALADSFESKDNQNFVIKLNPKAKWTDGQPLTADDVVFTLNLIANPKVETSKGSFIKMLDGVDDDKKKKKGLSAIPVLVAVDANKKKKKTRVPVDPDYLKSFLGFEVFITPKHIFEKIEPAAIASSEAATHPTVTSGPFQFVTYKTNDYVEYKANPNYYKGAPKLNKVFIRLMNGTNLVTALKAGNIQMAAGGGVGIIPLKDLGILEKDSNLIVKTVPSFMSQFLDVNNSRPEYNVAFRKAVTTAINRKHIVDQLFKGKAQLIPTIYTPLSPVYDKSVQPLAYDVEKAKQLLKESGYDTSKPITLIVPIGNVLREQSADLIQQDLTAIGLTVKLEKLDFPTLLAKSRKADFDMLLIGLVPTVDPDYSSYFIPGASNNYAHINDPKLTEMMLAAASMTSAPERKAAYGKIQEYMRDGQFLTALYSADNIIAQTKNLKGGIIDYWDGSQSNLSDWEFVNK